MPHRLALLVALLAMVLLPVAASAGNVPDIVTKVCAQCHGADGNSTIDTYPKLAGQQARYVARQIKEFVAGNRTHELMAPVIARLTDADVDTVATYFSQQKPASGIPGDQRFSDLGKLLYVVGNSASGLPSCDGCHAPDATGGARFPRLAGQHRAYLIKQMTDMREGRRNTSPLMRAVADRLSEIEIKALAHYLSGL